MPAAEKNVKKKAESPSGEEKKNDYDASSIRVLKGLEGVRKRPAMYIGDTGKRGLHHILEEVVDNSVDEHLAGHCSRVTITLHKNGSATIEDDGRGIPVDLHSELKKPALEVVLTTLHAGGKFDSKSYRISGGLHGVGVSVTNALSEWMKVTVKRAGKMHQQEYRRGIATTKMKTEGKTEETGTMITFKPDPKIFSELDFDYAILANRLEELSFLNAGIQIDILDERTGKKGSFRHEGGIKSYVKALNKTKNPIHPEPIYFHEKREHHELEVAMQYTDGYLKTVYSFVNGINTIEGGTHEEGWRTALTRALNKYLDEKESLQLKGDDVREGLTAVVSLRLTDPQFEGQTKTKLGNTEMKSVVAKATYEKLTAFLEENPQVKNIITTKVLEAAKAREAARKAKELVRRKSAFSTGSLPGKLADCQVRDPDKAELFIVEGDSAGGCFSGDTKVALIDGRDMTFKELVEEDKKGKNNYCYTIKEDGSIGVGLIKHPRITKRKAKVIKLTLDSGDVITCTPDHMFMNRDGGYTRADQLTETTSIMPLHRKISEIGGRITIKGYEMVLDPRSHKWVFTHLLSDRYNLEKNVYDEEGDCKHHIDFNKLNNNPDNLTRMDKQDHLILHTRFLERTAHNAEVKQKCREAHKRPEYRKRISEIMTKPEMRKMLSQRAKKQWEDEEYKKYMTKKFLEFYNSNKEYREKSLKRLAESQKEYWSKKENREKQSERVSKFFKKNDEARKLLSELSKRQWNDPVLRAWRSEKTKEQWTDEFREKRKKSYNKTYFDKTMNFMKQSLERNGDLRKYREERISSGNRNLLRMDTIAERFFEGDEKAMMETVSKYNHKLVGITELKEKMDVYDIEVEGTHNFALSSGVFVHNSSKQGRDRRIQAILPLRGKVLNTEKARIDKIYENNEISAMMTAIGTGINDECDPSKSRYGKVMILADSDVDGNHIVTLILTFFYRYMQPMINAGKIYVANAPLYRIKHRGIVHYVFTERDKEAFVKENGGEKGLLIQRFKGLGEMNPEQLWETTLNPETRRLKQITIEDAMIADETFSTLMGNEVEPRKEFIVNNSGDVKNLDV